MGAPENIWRLREGRKPLLLGMHNPLSDEAEYDLYPYPKQSTGYRLWKMLPEDTTRPQYLRAFERRNLIRKRTWDRVVAKKEAKKLLPSLAGRLVVVLGTEVRASLGLSLAEPLSVHLAELDDDKAAFAWVAFPHPSGRNRWFNSKDNYERACAVLTLLYEGRVDAGSVKLIRGVANV